MEEWRVILICGSAGTGKTTLSQALAGRLRVSVIQVDDIRLALQATISERANPDLHRFVGTVADKSFQSPTAVVEGLLGVADTVEPAVRAVMSHHIAVPGAGRVIIEGDGLRPRLGSVEYLREIDRGLREVAVGQVRTLVVYEDNPERVANNMAARGRGSSRESALRTSSQVLGSVRYGDLLTNEAAKYGIPAVAARPFGTLLQRASRKLALDL